MATHFEGRHYGFVHVTVVHPIAIMPYCGSLSIRQSDQQWDSDVMG
jgi:hypothetical protein